MKKIVCINRDENLRMKLKRCKTQDVAYQDEKLRMLQIGADKMIWSFYYLPNIPSVKIIMNDAQMIRKGLDSVPVMTKLAADIRKDKTPNEIKSHGKTRK